LSKRELLDAFAAQLATFVNKERDLEESRARKSRVIARSTESTFRFTSRTNEDSLARMSGACTAESDTRELRQAVRASLVRRYLLDATRLESGLLSRSGNGAKPDRSFARGVAVAGLNDNDVRFKRRQEFATISSTLA